MSPHPGPLPQAEGAQRRNIALSPREGVGARGEAGSSRNAAGLGFARAALIPPFVLLAVLSLPPTIGALLLAFRNVTLMSPRSRWVGFDNFARMLTDHRLHNALRISLLWEIVTVGGAMILAVLLGVLIFERVKGRSRDLICLALILPILLPRVSAGLIWRFMFSPLMGVINYPVQLAGLPPVEFLSQPSTALYAVAVVDVWQWGLFFAVIMLKLLDTLPKSPLEAARLDYASTGAVHWFVSLPMLRTALITMIFVKAVESLRSFDLIYTMTNGGPGIATETLDLYAYQTGIGMSGRISYAAAMSLLLLILSTLLFSFLWKRTQR